MICLQHFARVILLFAGITCAGAGASLAAHAFELTLVPPVPNGNPSIYRINIASGQVSNVTGVTAVATQDPQPIPAGDYRLYSVSSADGKGTFWLYRLETQSGRTWFLSNNGWGEIK